MSSLYKYYYSNDLLETPFDKNFKNVFNKDKIFKCIKTKNSVNIRELDIFKDGDVMISNIKKPVNCLEIPLVVYKELNDILTSHKDISFSKGFLSALDIHNDSDIYIVVSL